MSSHAIIFTPLLALSLLFFSWSLYQRLSLVALGQPTHTYIGFNAGLREMFINAFCQKRVLRKLFGFNHFIIFWSFMVLLLANGEFVLSGVFPALRLSLLPEPIYLAIRFASDIMSLLAIVAIAIALVRRTVAPPYEGARNLESYVILVLIAVHMFAYLGVAATEISLGHEQAAAYMPVSSLFADTLAGKNLDAAYNCYWWLHAFALLAFIVVLIPFTKHLHVFTAIANCFLRLEGKPNTQRPETFAKGQTYGARQVDRLTTKDLLDSYACTACGRCQNVCPANITGKPLNPREMVKDVQINLLANGPRIKKGQEATLPLIGEGCKGTVDEEAIWACTSCGACMEACPVFIEHLPKVVGMRRHLVEMESKFPEELLSFFENAEQRSNPWGMAPADRSKWSSLLGERPFSVDKTDYLFFVGCAGSFDNRAKQISVAVATIMDMAGVSWGMLGKDEMCCGDSLRRLGNEFVFDKMAKANVEMFIEKGVSKIVTSCPHCFSTLKNDYRQYGLDLEVIHHSELIAKLIQEGKLKLPRHADLGKVLFHDSCYLGRHNDIYNEPRSVIQAATGNAPAEFERNRENGFCCGAGGGRMWMEELTGDRINRNRVSEALKQQPDTLCVSCPYCMTMIEDGVKDLGASEQVQVKDVAEVVAEALRPQPKA
ncbi:MAG: (Fe-S)-binding protein [Desulfuromonadales bacterium]|nr:(Fe-S)-binding protein [Desulfuromonadales bacterium]